VGLSQAQAALGMSLTVASTYLEDENLSVRDQLRAAGVAVHLIGPAHGKLGRHRDLRAIVDTLVADADVVHIHALWEEIQHQTARACQRQGKPYIILPHGMLDPWSLAQGWLKKRLYMLLRLRRNLQRARALHYTTEIERDLTRGLKLHPEVIIEPPGLDLREFQDLPAKGSFRCRYPQLAGKKIVLFLSRLHYKKGLELLIEAFARADVADSALVLAGPDSEGYRAKLETLVAELGLGSRVVFTGMLHGPERVAALADADLFALTSFQENFGIAVTEALAAGTPVLISDQVNIHKEVSQAGVGAVTRLDVGEIATAMSRWLTDSALRAAAVEKARPWVWQRYDWRRIAERWQAHYQRVLSDTAVQARPGEHLARNRGSPRGLRGPS
jgi:glycosyltransferase involved in cell wall biosynthesis